MQKISKYIIKGILSVIIFFIFLNIIPFANYVNGFISEILIYETKSAVIGEKAISLEVADSEKKKIKGLSGREGLKENKGMLFLFGYDASHGIWMKDMKFSIDIIWINKHFEVVHIEQNVSPDTYPEIFAPEVSSRFVVEMEAGFVETHNIKKGDLFTIL